MSHPASLSPGDRYLEAIRGELNRLAANEVDDFARRLDAVLRPLCGHNGTPDTHNLVDDLIYWALGTLIVEAVDDLDARDGRVLVAEIEAWLKAQCS